MVPHGSDFGIEQELNILASEAEDKEHLYYQQNAQAITALLGTDELMDMALESWNNLLESQFNEETSPTSFQTGDDLIPDLIQILFDLSPVLRAARHTYFVDLEEARAEIIGKDQADQLVTSSSVEPPTDDVESKLDAVDEILSTRDDDAAKKANTSTDAI